MAPTRRTLLHTTGLLTAGALAGGPAAGTALEASNDTYFRTVDDTDAAPRSAGSGGRRIALQSVDDAPALPVDPSVEVVKPVATDDHPPRLRVTVENESDECVRVGEARSIFFQFVSDDTRALVFLPVEGDYPAEADCWRLTEGIAITMEYRTISLAPSESRSNCIDLFATPDEERDTCLPTGEFPFEAQYNVAPFAEEPPTGSLNGEASSGSDDDESAARQRQATWGFSIVLE